MRTPIARAGQTRSLQTYSHIVKKYGGSPGPFDIKLAALTADPTIRDSSVSGYCVIASSLESIDHWFTMSFPVMSAI